MMETFDVHPLRDCTIGIIGAGAMGGALCRGLVTSGLVSPQRILVSDPHKVHVDALQSHLGVRSAADNQECAAGCDILLLAVKPYMVAEVTPDISAALTDRQPHELPLVISIAAGIRTSFLAERLPKSIPLVRAMPNTPAQVGLGACAYCGGQDAAPHHLRIAGAIFRAVGTAVEVTENHMDAVTALSGSGPAYVYLMIEALIDGGVKVGLPRDTAHALAAQTVLGAAQMVLQTGLHPAQLRDMVTTPAGTTIEALASLEHSGVRAALIDAVVCAAERSKQLG